MKRTDNTDIYSLGNWIRNRRVYLGLTQEETARIAGLGWRTLCHLERGYKRSTHRLTIEKLAKALSMDPDELGIIAGMFPPWADDIRRRKSARILQYLRNLNTEETPRKRED